MLTILLFAADSFSSDFRYIRTEDGLTDGEINSIVQDSTGNMWFATWSGLVKYDGYYYELFRPEIGNPHSLPEKKIKLLFVDSQDNLWIGTSMNLCRYNKYDKSFYTYDFEGIPHKGVNIIGLSELSGNLVVHAVDGIYLLPFSEAGNPHFIIPRFQILLGGVPYNNYINYSSTINKEQLVLVSYNSETSSQIFFATLKKFENRNSIHVDTVLQINDLVNDINWVPGENSLYFATTKGLMPFSLGKLRFVDRSIFPGKDIQKIFYASNHRIYASLPEPRLLYLDLHTGLTGEYQSNPIIPGSLLDNEIHSIYEDFSGNLWIGHQGQGLSILNLYQKKFQSFKRDPFKQISLNSNTVMCFEGTENEIIIGCRSNGLNIISRNQIDDNKIEFQTIPLKQKQSPGNINDGIWDIAKQSDSLFWVGTELGLYRLSRNRLGWKLDPFDGNPGITHSIRKIFIDSNNNIWCGTHGFGLIFIPNLQRNPDGISYQYNSVEDNPESLSDNVILDIFLDNKKRFWVGTNFGFNRLISDYDNYDLSGKSRPDLTFKRYIAEKPLANYLNNNEVNSFFENFDGTLWIATQGGGINILDPETDKFHHLTTNNGLPSNDIIGMVHDEDGNLWISTIKGLVRYNRFERSPYFTVFNAADGIQGETFMINSFYKATDGQLFFGGDKGFTSFYPKEIQINEIKPKIAFTELRIRNRIVEIGDTLYRNEILEKSINVKNKITLPYKNNVFSIGVSALHFQHPENNSIFYTLEGFHDNWLTVPASLRYIYLSNVPPGTYRLRARTISSDRIMSDDEKSLIVEITPPWYRTWFAFILYGIVVVALTFGFIFVLVNRQKLIYQKKIDKLTIENNENKMMFLTNIAHELRTPLSLIIAPVEDLVTNLQVDYQWKNHLQLISRNSHYLLRLINQIIDFRKLNAGKLTFQPQQADIVRVVKDVVLNFKGFESSRNISLQVNIPSEPLIFSFDVQKMEEVLYNLISNAFKHTPDNHSIVVSLSFKEKHESDNHVLITVFNEGKEIEEFERSKIFERFYKIDDKSEGAGIGLSFAKSLVEMHSGTIDVESISGKGVAFYVKLPFVKTENVHQNESLITDKTGLNKVPTVQQETTGIEKNEHTILIVEDNAEIGEFLVSVFSRKYNCLFASNGEVGWKLVQKQFPSVIITDVIMPRMDGLELCKKVKENRETCHIPVLLLTAKDSPEQVAEGYTVGADSYVTKPFDVTLLVSQTERLIKNRMLIREKYRTQNFMVEVITGNITRDEELVQEVRNILEKNISDPEFNVNKLSQELNISTTQLYRRLKEITNYSPVEFIRIVKLQKAYGLLSKRSNTVKEVCYLTGFNNMSYFIKCFREQFGVTPAYFRDNGLMKTKIEKVTDSVKN
ncbi:two-component regulator propeller domain-containing protein [Mariniphaga sp.]|uniref:hybrid sensor histidine kinase/response regulator transcription factor n=1 Tax=Mariniphaga sp. TaxID=1954475 RepID=UPI003562461E